MKTKEELNAIKEEVENLNKCYYSQSDNNKRKLRACSRACGYYYSTMEAGQNT